MIGDRLPAVVKSVRDAAVFVLVLGCLFLPSVAHAEDEVKYSLHEISLWGLDPTLEQANEQAHYPSAMPGVVDTERSRANEARKLTPVGLITLHGEPVKDLEIDLRVQSGRFVGHWPPAESKSGRLRWLDTSTTTEGNEGLFATVDEKHWFNQARSLDSLYVKDKSRCERFITYDVELKYEVPVQITGGPDKYQITNSAKHPLLDLFVIAPEEGGLRVGHLETLPPSPPKAAGAVAGQGDGAVLRDLPGKASEANTWRLDVLDKAKASQRVEGDITAFQVDATTGTDWHVQALRPNLDLKEGQEYTVKFQAKASANRAVTLAAGIDQEDWHDIGLRETVALTGEFQSFEFKFRAHGVVKEKNRIGFVLGGEAGTVFIREMSLVQADAKPEVAAPAAPTKPEGDKADPKPAEKAPEKPEADKAAETGKPTEKADAEKPAEVKEQPAVVAAAPAVVVVAAPGGAVAVAAPGAPVAVPAQPAAQAPAAKPAVPLEATELGMSSVVAVDSEEVKSVSESLRASLLKLGLTRQEIDLALDRAGAALAEPKEMIVLCRLPPEAIEERMPLVAYPAPRKTVRTALLMVRNIDPKIKDEVQKLIADLGSAEYKHREDAEKRLSELGRLAIPALKNALKSGDLEIVFRAERILLAQNEKLEGT